ncbi:MAG: S8 family serine peptidase, partial [Chloroflexota bacterium]
MIRRNISLVLAALAVVALVVTGSGPRAATGNDQSEQRGFAPGRLLVGLEDAAASPSAASSELQSTLRRHNATAVRAIGESGTHVVSTPPGRELALARALSRDPGIAFAEPDYTVTTAEIPDDPRFDELWGLHNDDDNPGTPDADIDAPEAWDITTGTSTVVVAVLDTGVDYTHPDLAANIWVNEAEASGEPGVDDDGNGWVDDVHGVDTLNDDGDPMDDSGNSHGTHVAGTIGAVGDNGIGVTGVSQRVSIMPLKFLDDEGNGFISGAIAAIDYVRDMKARGVNVVVANNSWTSDGVSEALRQAISDAADDGILFTAAAGNSGQDIEESPKSPASIDLPNIIGVAASDWNDQRPGFSNWGCASVDLAAPGNEILSTSIGGGYHTLSGTSMAAPHVSGAAALLWAQDPARSYSEVRKLLLGSVDQIDAWKAVVLTGGRLNAHDSLLAGDEATTTEAAREAIRETPSAASADDVWTLSDPLFPFAVGKDGAATVQWEPPRRDCGDPPDEYVLTSDPSSPESPLVISGSSTTATMSGLENGTDYTFTVQARNSLGAGEPSAPSNPVTPQPPPAPEASPSSFDLELEPGTSTTRNLTIGNSGAGPMTYQLHAAPPVMRSAAAASAESVTGVEALARDLFAVQE